MNNFLKLTESTNLCFCTFHVSLLADAPNVKLDVERDVERLVERLVEWLTDKASKPTRTWS